MSKIIYYAASSKTVLGFHPPSINALSSKNSLLLFLITLYLLIKSKWVLERSGKVLLKFNIKNQCNPIQTSQKI